MTQIRRVLDLENGFAETETTATRSEEDALDVADKLAEETNVRYTHTEVFGRLRGKFVNQSISTTLN